LGGSSAGNSLPDRAETISGWISPGVSAFLLLILLV
jgi:hypothetical protein